MIYVDTAYIPYGRMIMCHMMADTHSELLWMAEKIGLSHKHLQKAGTPYEHFDVSKMYRARAMANGAVEVSRHDLVSLIRRKRVAAGGRWAYPRLLNHDEKRDMGLL